MWCCLLDSTGVLEATAVVSASTSRPWVVFTDPKHFHDTFCLPSQFHFFWLTALFNSQPLQRTACPSKETPTTSLISEGSGLDPSSIRQVMGRVSNPPLPKENLTSSVERFLILLELISHFHAKGQLSLINKFIIWCPGWHVLFVLPQARSTASSTVV